MRPFPASQRGDSGRICMPAIRMSGHTIPIAITVRQLPLPDISRVPMEMQYATRMPKVMNSWYVAVSEPRICGGAVSAWYMGTAAESPPTPRPEMRRPMATCGQEVKAVTWMTTPTMKMMDSSCMARRRPRKSANLCIRSDRV